MVRAADSERMKLDFAMTERQYADVHRRLFGPSPKEFGGSDPERGFLATIVTATGLNRRTLLLGEVIEPLPGDVRWVPGRGLVMSHHYYSRAISSAQSLSGTGLINVHSHPGPHAGTAPPGPSGPDLASDAMELFAVSRALGSGRPIAAAIASPGGGLSVREYLFKQPSTVAEARKRQFGPKGAKIVFATHIRIVGPHVLLRNANPNQNSADQDVDIDATNSSALLWGVPGQRVLAELTVGLAGLGGVGGMLTEYLARLGVGKLVLVDYDRLERANLNRSQGVSRAETQNETAKVVVYERIARGAATAPRFQVSAFRESVAEPAGLKPLLDCDLIIGAADDAFARQVLDHVAYAHLIPVIDGGTILRADTATMKFKAGKSQVATAGPSHPCLECQGVYTQEEATVARESAEWGRYLEVGEGNPGVREEDVRAPSVICNNGLVASLIGLRLLTLVLQLAPRAAGTQRYYVEDGILTWGAVMECKSDCLKRSWIGKGDQHYIPTGIDLRWKAMRAAEARGRRRDT